MQLALAQETSQLQATRADLAVRTRNMTVAIAALSVVGFAVAAGLVVVSRVKKATAELNDKLTVELDERTEELRCESERRHELELVSERKQRHEALGLIAAGVSHDFNNLLAVISNSHQTLGRKLNLSEDQKELLGLAADATEQASGVVDQLMTYAKAKRLDIRVIDVRGWLHSSESLFRSTIGESISFHIVCDVEANIRLDESQLTTAVINLLSNARDAVAESQDPQIKLSIQVKIPDDPASETDWVQISVWDNGCGIDRELINQVLDPYVTTKEGIGTGLGLSIVSGFVEKAHGNLALDSSNNGTRVTMSFPCVAPAERIRRESQNWSATGQKLLLVDDNVLVRRSTALMLADAGFQVIEAGSAEVAVEVLEKNPSTDFVLSDVKMPGEMDGITLRKKIMRQYPGIPVLLMTGHFPQGLEPGTHVVGKPFALDEVMEALGNGQQG